MSSHVLALVGSPNTGKSSLFNALTGSHQKVGNYPGVTVEKKLGTLRTPAGRDVTIIDLPGTYSLDPHSPDEQVTTNVLFRRVEIPEHPSIILAVADATNLERTLGLVTDLSAIGLPVVVALNMYDLATKRGLKLDVKILEKELNALVVPTVAVKRGGTQPLLQVLDRSMERVEKLATKTDHTSIKIPLVDINSLLDRQKRVDQILAKAMITPTSADQWTRRIDQVLLHPVFGSILLAVILLTLFQGVFTWAEAPMTWIEDGIAALGDGIRTTLPDGPIQNFIVDGVIAGVGSVIVFLPQILILFFFILILEASGYMARAAFIMDRLMSAVGLQGRSFVPLLSSFACAIPGIMAARTIRSPRDRLLTIMISPLMTCSARLPVYVLLIGAFIPSTPIFGPLELQGLVMFGLFATGIVSAMVVAFVLKSVALPGSKSPFLMDLPTYKLPNPRYVAFNLWQRAKAFLKRAGTVILFISIGLWFLSSYPKPPEGATDAAINYSIAGRVGNAIEPLVRPLGFDWRIATGLIPGFAAREVMVGALGTVFAVENAEDEGLTQLQDRIKATWGVPTGLALLVWYIFSPQCLATFAVARRETNSRKWTAVMFGYMLALAYVAAFITYQVSRLFF